jgi:hypothetical protein
MDTRSVKFPAKSIPWTPYEVYAEVRRNLPAAVTEEDKELSVSIAVKTMINAPNATNDDKKRVSVTRPLHYNGPLSRLTEFLGNENPQGALNIQISWRK